MSEIAAMYRAVAERDPALRVDVGAPSGPGWIRGVELTDARGGAFHDLLLRIGARMQSGDKRTIAASFLLRFGWVSGLAIAPYVLFECVPDVRLDNVSFRFKESTFFERATLHEPRGLFLPRGDRDGGGLRSEPATSNARDALLRRLRETLHAQSEPVVRALHAWSGFAPKGSWGLLTSSWASQFVTACGRLGPQAAAVPVLDALFESRDAAAPDEVTRMRPGLHLVSCEQSTHVFQRRSSCCRYYLLPRGHLCASCPLVSHEERLQKNLAWMQDLLDRERRRATAPGHA
jgi:hypothetical protein